MSIEVKQKIKDVADDFAMPAKKLIEIVGKFYEKPKSSSQNLSEDQLNVIVDYITQQNQIDSIEQVFAAAAQKKEAPAPAPAQQAKPAAPAQTAQAGNQPRPQGGQSQPRPQQQGNAPRPQQNGQRPAQPQGGQNQPRPQQTAAQPAAKQPQPERKRERRVIDTSAVTVNADRYDDRVDSLVSDRVQNYSSGKQKIGSKNKKQQQAKRFGTKSRSEEQEKMRIASRLNDQVMDRIIHALPEDHTETELADLLLQYYLDAGCSGYSFEPITAFAGNAADPHHVTDGSRGKRGDCVVLDIGGRKDDYCSDMTRTVFLGEVSDRQREIYEIVKEANLRGIAAAKPGARMCDVDKAARDYIAEKGFGKYFTHRTGHSIGLEVHEAGDVSAINEAVIRPGQCFSVEPGIYIPEEGIGVRIEDLVLITADGCEVLNHYPKDLTVVPFK